MPLAICTKLISKAKFKLTVHIAVNVK